MAVHRAKILSKGSAVKAGDKIDFVAEQVNGVLTVTKLEKK